MRARTFLAIASWVVFLSSGVHAGDSVLYSVTTSESHSGIPVVKTQVFKTEIFAVDAETGKQRLVFSDANVSFFLMPGGRLRGGIVAAGGKIFAEGIEPVQSAAHTPKFDPAAPAAIYELSTDGSGQARKVFDTVRGEQSVNCGSQFLNSSGSEIGSVNYLQGKYYLVVCDTATGKLLRNSQLKYGSEERRGWRFGSISRIGWMTDDKRIFFTIELAGDSDDAWWDHAGSPVGTHVLGPDADTGVRLAPEAALHPRIVGMQPSDESAAVLIGTLPDGGYLLQDYEGDTNGAGGPYFYELDLASKTQKIFPLRVDGDLGSFHLSHSGNRLVLMATQKEIAKQPSFASIATLSVWIMDLESGKQRKLLSFPPHDETHGADGPWVNLIGWLGN